jgi:hypothetical protein
MADGTSPEISQPEEVTPPAPTKPESRGSARSGLKGRVSLAIAALGGAMHGPAAVDLHTALAAPDHTIMQQDRDEIPEKYKDTRFRKEAEITHEDVEQLRELFDYFKPEVLPKELVDTIQNLESLSPEERKGKVIKELVSNKYDKDNKPIEEFADNNFEMRFMVDGVPVAQFSRVATGDERGGYDLSILPDRNDYKKLVSLKSYIKPHFGPEQEDERANYYLKPIPAGKRETYLGMYDGSCCAASIGWLVAETPDGLQTRESATTVGHIGVYNHMRYSFDEPKKPIPGVK